MTAPSLSVHLHFEIGGLSNVYHYWQGLITKTFIIYITDWLIDWCLKAHQHRNVTSIYANCRGGNWLKWLSMVNDIQWIISYDTQLKYITGEYRYRPVLGCRFRYSANDRGWWAAVDWPWLAATQVGLSAPPQQSRRSRAKSRHLM